LAASFPLASGPSAERLALALIELALVPVPVPRPFGAWAAVGARLVAPLREPLERRRSIVASEALAQVARRWKFIPPSARTVAKSVGTGRWDGLLLSLASDPDPSARIGLAELAAETHVPAVLATLIRDPERAVTEAAERAIIALAEEAKRWPGDDSVSPNRPMAERDALETCLAAAVVGFADHRRRGVLLAALRLVARTPSRRAPRGALEALLTDRDHPSHTAMRSAIRRMGGALTRDRAWVLLGCDAVGGACVDRLAQAASAEEHDAVLVRSHLALSTARARRLRLIDANGDGKRGSARTGAANKPSQRGGLVGAVPDPDVVPGLSVRARRGLPRWVAGLDIGDDSRRIALKPLLADADPFVRHGAMRLAGARDLMDFCLDPDERIATAALRSWSAAGVVRAKSRRSDPVNGRFARNLLRSPHALVRELAEQEVERQDPWNPRSAAGLLAAHGLLRADRAGFLKELEGRIGAGEERARVEALMLARRLRVQDAVQNAIVAAAADRGAAESVRATALAALGDATGPGAVAAVRAALHEGEGRTRANAVEAAIRLGRGCEAKDLAAGVIELKGDDHHRVRATVLRALIAGLGDGEAEGLSGTAAMLGDERSVHRMAGLWVTQRTAGRGRDFSGDGWGRIAARVADMAKGDPDELVRTRARRCAERMVVELRSGWRGRAIGVGEAR
jgi:hypothetical protein